MDNLRIQITANPGETFLDRMIALVEGAKRQKTPNEIALTALGYPSSRRLRSCLSVWGCFVLAVRRVTTQMTSLSKTKS